MTNSFSLLGRLAEPASGAVLRLRWTMPWQASTLASTRLASAGLAGTRLATAGPLQGTSLMIQPPVEACAGGANHKSVWPTGPPGGRAG